MNSGYLKYKHRILFTGWLNTGMGQSLPPSHATFLDTVPGSRDTRYDAFSFNFRYENGTERITKGSSVFLHARMLDGLDRFGGGWRLVLPNKKTTVQAELIYLLRRDSTDLTYLLYPDQWEPGRLNGFDVRMDHRYEYERGKGELRLELRNSAVGSAPNYAQVRFTAVNTSGLGRLELRTRGFGQFGTGNTPRESALYLAGASPIDPLARVEGLDALGSVSSMGEAGARALMDGRSYIPARYPWPWFALGASLATLGMWRASRFPTSIRPRGC